MFPGSLPIVSSHWFIFLAQNNKKITNWDTAVGSLIHLAFQVETWVGGHVCFTYWKKGKGFCGRSVCVRRIPEWFSLRNSSVWSGQVEAVKNPPWFQGQGEIHIKEQDLNMLKKKTFIFWRWNRCAIVGKVMFFALCIKLGTLPLPLLFCCRGRNFPNSTNKGPPPPSIHTAVWQKKKRNEISRQVFSE